MTTRFLEPASGGIRQPNDNNKMNGPVINQPRYAEHGGLTGASKVAQANPLKISKPNGGRG